MKNVLNFALVGGFLLSLSLGCADQKSNSNVTTSQRIVPSPKPTGSQAAETFRIPPDSVPATDITRDFDDKLSDLKAAVKKWRLKRVTFHGTVYTIDKGDDGRFKVSLAGHDGMFTVFCRDIPASQSHVVAKLEEDQTVVAISGVILGSGTTGLVPGRIDDDVMAEKCSIVD